MKQFRAILLAVLILATVAPAALLRVGPTRAFKTIQAAVNAAVNGDLILVDPGTYAPFFVAGKGIAILNAGARITISPSNSVAAIRVIAVPAGQTTTVMGFQTNVAFGGFPSVQILGCSGSVRILDAVITPTVNLVNVPMRAVVDIISCAAVTLYDVQINPSSPRNGRTTNGVSAPGGTDNSISAVSASNSKVHLNRCQLRGYDNLGNPSTGLWGGDGLRLFGASLARLDDAPSAYVGGAGGQYGGSAVQLIATNPVLDVSACSVPSGSFLPGTGSNPGGFLALNHDRGYVGMFQRVVPVCLAASAGGTAATSRMRINNNYPVTIWSLYSRTFALYMAPTTVQPIAGVQNTAYINYTSPQLAFLGAGVLPAPLPIAGVTLSIPNNAALFGYQFGLQSVFGPPLGQAVPALTFSMASPVTITP